MRTSCGFPKRTASGFDLEQRICIAFIHTAAKDLRPCYSRKHRQQKENNSAWLRSVCGTREIILDLIRIRSTMARVQLAVQLRTCSQRPICTGSRHLSSLLCATVRSYLRGSLIRTYLTATCSATNRVRKKEGSLERTVAQERPQ